MSTFLSLVLATTATVAPLRPATVDGRATVTIDSARHEVVIRVGSFAIGKGGHGYGDHAADAPPPLARFEWPVDGWVRGATLRYLDAAGRELPATVGHHANLINFGRRQLLYPAYERLASWGPETGAMMLPATVGIPMQRGMPMGVTVYWHNHSGMAFPDVTVEIVAKWTPSTARLRPVDVLIEYVNVVYPVGRSGTFDVPTGSSRQSASFTQPIDARILAAGGHLHDHAVAMALREAGGRQLFSLTAERQADGRVAAVERILPGVRGDGIRLRAGRRYTLDGSYDNGSTAAVPDGGMVNLVMLVAPERPSDWPALDPDDPELAIDLRYLLAHGRQGGGHH